jgi:large subunit ribosomal protein L25
MSEIVVEAQIRKDIRKRARKVRNEGMIPGIFYGHGEKNIPIQTTLAALRPVVYTSDTNIVSLKLDNGETKTCIIRAIQFNPITDKIEHFDLYALRADEKVTMEIPISLKGTAKGVKDGGMVQHILHRVEVKCFPRDIPEHIDVDIVELGIGDSIHVSSLNIPNVEILEDPDTTIVSVVPPTVLKEPVEEAAEVAGEEMAEPELVGKGKKEDEGAESADSGTK